MPNFSQKNKGRLSYLVEMFYDDEIAEDYLKKAQINQNKEAK